MGPEYSNQNLKKEHPADVFLQLTLSILLYPFLSLSLSPLAQLRKSHNPIDLKVDKSGKQDKEKLRVEGI